jgi:transcriptional regulator with XRE-family HTH domain
MRSQIVDRLLKNTPKDVEIFVDWYADLVVRINQLLRENNLSKKELAERLDKKPSEISKWLNGEHNFTLRSLAKLSAELGEPLLEVPKRKAQPTFISGYGRSVRTFIVYKNLEPKQPAKMIEWQLANELNQLSNVG